MSVFLPFVNSHCIDRCSFLERKEEYKMRRFKNYKNDIVWTEVGSIKFIKKAFNIKFVISQGHGTITLKGS